MKDKLFSKVYMWMFIGLLVSAVAAFVVSTNELLVNAIYGGSWYIGLIILELVIVIYLSRKIRDLSPSAAKLSFLVYSLINGMTLASIFIIYELGSIALIFGLTALIFGAFSLIGFVTKVDLSKIGSIAFMALFGIIIAYIVNMFLQSAGLGLSLSIVGILIFIVLIAYDTQKIKAIATYIPNEDNAAVYGALILYLDFINIFIRLLHLFGRARD